jgi:hypothetical protein
MKKVNLFVAAFAVAAVAVVASAKELQLQDNGIRVTPIWVAPAQMVDGKVVLGEKIPYTAPVQTGYCPSFGSGSYYDGFEGTDLGVPTDTVCGLGGSRWFFGTTYNNGAATNDMIPDGPGGQAEQVNFGWYWGACPINDNGDGTADCVVIVFTGTTWDDCAGFDGGYDGVAYGFGALTCDPGFYYYTNVDLTGSGLFHELADASWYQIIYQSNGGLADTAQPMLWGPDSTLGKDLPGATDANEWDDDNPADGAYDPNTECYDYAFGICPDPLGAMIEFCGGSSGLDCSKINKYSVKCTRTAKVVAKAKTSLDPGTEVTFVLDGSSSKTGTVNSRGIVKAKFKNVPDGSHEVCIEGCESTACKTTVCGG